MKREKIFHKIAKTLSKFNEVDLAYAHGSFLKRDDFNDIDIALLISSNPPIPYECFKFTMKISREIEREVKPGCEVDIKILNYSPLAFQYEVIRDGKPIFIRNDDMHVRYEARVLSEYLDFKETMLRFDREFLSTG